MRDTDSLLSEVLDALHLLRPSAPPALARLLSEVWGEWTATQSPQMREKARSIWAHQVGRLEGPLGELLPPRLASWEAELYAAGYAPRTIRAAYGCLAGAVSRLVRLDVLPALPWRAWRPRSSALRHPRDAMREVSELEDLLLAAHERDEAAQAIGRVGDLRARIAVAALQGLRQGELAGLAWDDVDLVQGFLHIRRQALDSWRRLYPNCDRCPALPKGGRARSLSLHPDAARALEAQRGRLRELGYLRDRGPVFPGVDGAFRANATAIKPELFKRVVGAAGLPREGFVPHSLRHSAATLELRAGADVRTVQARLGHASLTTTEGYLHADRVPAPSRIRRLAGVRW